MINCQSFTGKYNKGILYQHDLTGAGHFKRPAGTRKTKAFKKNLKGFFVKCHTVA